MRRLVVAVAVLLVSCTTTSDQPTARTATLRVRVLEASSHAPLPGATVTTATSVETTTLTVPESGEVAVVTPVSRIVVTAYLNGFEPATRKIHLSIGHEQTVELLLNSDPEFAPFGVH
jgi:hypothetical protein